MYAALQDFVVALTGVDGAIEILGNVDMHFQCGYRTAPQTRSIGQIETLHGDSVLPPANLGRRITRAGITDQLGTYARHQILGRHTDLDRLRWN